MGLMSLSEEDTTRCRLTMIRWRVLFSIKRSCSISRRKQLHCLLFRQASLSGHRSILQYIAQRFSAVVMGIGQVLLSRVSFYRLFHHCWSIIVRLTSVSWLLESRTVCWHCLSHQRNGTQIRFISTSRRLRRTSKLSSLNSVSGTIVLSRSVASIFWEPQYFAYDSPTISHSFLRQGDMGLYFPNFLTENYIGEKAQGAKKSQSLCPSTGF